MNYCVEQKGMNQPLTIEPDQVKINPEPKSSTGDINPKADTPGLSFDTMNPSFEITVKEPATFTVIYLPNDRPNRPSNINQFVVVISFPDGRPSEEFTSNTPTSALTTTTPSSGAASETTTPSSNAVVPPSSSSPQVNLPVNYRIPVGAVITITVISTTNQAFPQEVRS